ncbi:hypothetical protein SUGI_1198290 [Cryptomeria japonica]|uniref:E3 ubiquitin-protein ligase PUB23-like n=1 Tax=Cryptomeria japonica TaxID=3369 RepID=UPI0024148D85|nr:E3 ubiquitin-protein ligase PUB23-like [Cryptomeria japonica]GLJ55812.1 hypothetical protein SUGI_1198290 [Cryptomeria japonica]
MDSTELEIPSYFLCPISMQLMADPVTLSTGATYDRHSIEKWVYTMGNNTCPLTKQPLPNTDLTPNHTLRRLIQQWCVLNSSAGVHRISTPRPPLDADRLNKLLQDMASFQLKSLKKLRSAAAESEGNSRFIASSAAPVALISVIESYSTESDEAGYSYDVAVACEEALGILYSLPLPDETLDSIATSKCLASLAAILKRGTSSARFYSSMLLQTLSRKCLERLVMNANDELIEGLLELLTEEVSHQTTVAALEMLSAIASNSRRMRMKTIEAGAVSVLIESLPNQTLEKKGRCERMLCLLDVLCGCAEGRAAVADHAMGIPAVSKKILRVSDLATEKAVRILWLLCKISPSKRVIDEMLQIGAVTELCLLLNYACSAKTRSKVNEVLRMHGKCWKSRSCISSVNFPE